MLGLVFICLLAFWRERKNVGKDLKDAGNIYLLPVSDRRARKREAHISAD